MAKLSFVVRTDNVEIKHPGRYPIRLRITQKNRVKYVDSGLYVGTSVVNGKACVNFLNGFVTAREPHYNETNNELARLLHRYTNALNSVQNPALLTLEEMADRVLGIHGTATTVEAWGDEYASQRNKRYADMVRLSVRYWIEFAGKNYSIHALRPQIVAKFGDFLRGRYKLTQNGEKSATGQKMSDASVNKTLAHLKAIVNFAMKHNAVQYDVHPFADTKIHRSKANRCEVEPEDVTTIKNAILGDGPIARARDMWLLSFYMGGMNLCDMLAVDWSGPRVIFQRTKTRCLTSDEFVLPIIEEAREIADRYMDDSGHLDIGLKSEPIRNIGKALRKLREQLGLGEKFCFYSARHTFAQCCLNLCIPDAITNYMMAHSDSRGILGSYSRVSPRIAAKVMRRLIDYTNDPDKFEDAMVDALFSRLA